MRGLRRDLPVIVSVKHEVEGTGPLWSVSSPVGSESSPKGGGSYNSEGATGVSSPGPPPTPGVPSFTVLLRFSEVPWSWSVPVRTQRTSRVQLFHWVPVLASWLLTGRPAFPTLRPWGHPRVSCLGPGPSVQVWDRDGEWPTRLSLVERFE